LRFKPDNDYRVANKVANARQAQVLYVLRI
jgi:hypothetical protein